MAHTPGTVIDRRFTLVRPLGAGGMGEVWIARQASLDRDVALKLMKGDDDDLVARFQREARAVSRVHHDNVVVVHDTGTCATTGASFIAMELIDGANLRAAMKRGALPLVRANEIARQVLSGLAAAHAAGIIHRDVKPENVMLARTAHGERAKLVDFGIARGVAAGDTMTATGSYLGTPGYTAPEIALGARNNDPKSDLYAVGVLWWEMLAGHTLFAAPSALAVAMRHAGEPAPLVTTARSDVPPHVAALIARLLEKEPAKRPSAAEALATLGGDAPGAAGPTSAASAGPLTRTRRATPALAHDAGAATVTATQVSAGSWTVLLANPLATVGVNARDRLVRFTRSAKRHVGDELDPSHALVLQSPGGLDMKSAAVLVDFRLAPLRNDPAFEVQVDRWLKGLVDTYRRTAVLVRTATGRLQAERNMRQYDQQLRVFSDEDEALRFLTEP